MMWCDGVFRNNCFACSSPLMTQRTRVRIPSATALRSVFRNNSSAPAPPSMKQRTTVTVMSMLAAIQYTMLSPILVPHELLTRQIHRGVPLERARAQRQAHNAKRTAQCDDATVRRERS
jgi:hypothetical protein